MMRVVGLMIAAFIAVSGLIGVLRNDLPISMSKSSVGVLHLHGRLAWLCFTGMMMFSAGTVLFVGPPFGEGKFDFDERRFRFGWMVLIGVGLMGASYGMASP